MIKLKKIFAYIFLIFIGLIVSYYKGYGDDLDSSGLVKVFINIYEKGYYSPSRFQGSFVSEIFYGPIAFFFGSFICNLFSYFFFLLAIYFIFKAYFDNYFFSKNIFLFILICFSNPVLFLDNTNISDSSLGLLLFSIGIFLLKKNNKFYSPIFFGLAIGTRFEYSLYVFLILFLELIINKKLLRDYKQIIIFTYLIGFLFYVPLLINNKFGLLAFSNNFIIMNLEGRLSRFVYKTYLTIGNFSSLLILFILFKNFKKLKNILILNKDLGIIILCSSLVFIYMPTKTSIISLLVIFVYIILFKIINKTFLFYLLIIFNLAYYVTSYQIFEFEYKNLKKCDPIVAYNAKINFKFTNGYFFQRDNFLKNQIECSSKLLGNRSENFLNGKRLKLD